MPPSLRRRGPSHQSVRWACARQCRARLAALPANLSIRLSSSLLLLLDPTCCSRLGHHGCTRFVLILVTTLAEHQLSSDLIASEHPSIRASEHLSIRASKLPSSRAPAQLRPHSVQASDHPGIRASAELRPHRVRVSEHPNIRAAQTSSRPLLSRKSCLCFPPSDGSQDLRGKTNSTA